MFTLQCLTLFCAQDTTILFSTLHAVSLSNRFSIRPVHLCYHPCPDGILLLLDIGGLQYHEL